MNVAGSAPDIHYAKSAGLNIAFSVTGGGPDLVVAPGFISHLDIMWEEPSVVHFYSRLASFRRVVTFDKRGTGLSDPAMHAPTLEESVDDLRAVMDAAGCERADLVGISEGGTMAMLMTAGHPDRVKALVLYGTFSRLLRAPDYPLGVTEEQLSALVEMSAKGWGEGVGLGGWAPSRRNDADLRRWWARLQRVAASPGMVRNIFALYPQLDIRDVLPAIQVPTLVLHRRDDRMVALEMSRYLADRIPGAKFVELNGADHLFFTGDADSLLDEIEEFLTGVRPLPAVERVLTTVLFTDIVDSTKRAVELGDERWKELLGRHDAQVRRQLERFRGREVNTTGDGFLARFDGPGPCDPVCHGDPRRAAEPGPRGARGRTHGRGRAARRRHQRHRRPHRRARVSSGRGGRGARLAHRRRPGRWVGPALCRSRRARPQGRGGRVGAVRGRGLTWSGPTGEEPLRGGTRSTRIAGPAIG